MKRVGDPWDPSKPRRWVVQDDSGEPFEVGFNDYQRAKDFAAKHAPCLIRHQRWNKRAVGKKFVVERLEKIEPCRE